jgi:hypothetical protein
MATLARQTQVISREKRVQMHLDPEAGKEMPKPRYCPTAPSIFRILSLCIVFLSITVVVAGMVSGDWQASFCKYSTFQNYRHLLTK